MSKATLFYLLSEQGRKDSILKGENGKEFQSIETEATPEILELAQVKPDGRVLLSVGCNVDSNENYRAAGYSYPLIDYEIKEVSPHGRPDVKQINKETHFDTVQTPEQLIAHEKARVTHIEARKSRLEAELAPMLEKWKAEEAEKDAEEVRKKKILEEKNAEYEKAREAEKSAHESEKLDWIHTHGSEYLRDAVELGYDCQRKYATERSTLEFPDFTLDFGGDAGWKSRSCPSLEALREVKDLVSQGLNAEVVWLTEPVDKEKYCVDDDEYDCKNYIFEPCEVIVIKNYLGKYDLVKIIE